MSGKCGNGSELLETQRMYLRWHDVRPLQCFRIEVTRSRIYETVDNFGSDHHLIPDLRAEKESWSLTGMKQSYWTRPPEPNRADPNLKVNIAVIVRL